VETCVFLGYTFPTSYRVPQTEIVCQSYALEKLIHHTTQNGVHKGFGFSSSGLRVLDFIYVKKAFRASFKIILLQMQVVVTSLLRYKLPPF
jgi:hypothetical protein